MTSSKTLAGFLADAKAQGLSDHSLIVLLRGRGWPEADVHRALSDFYESNSAVQIPSYRRSGSARDAFLYLLSFSTLAIWTLGAGAVLFLCIDEWIKDPLSTNNYYGSVFSQMANSLACVIVGFPVYLFATRYIIRELLGNPEKAESPVRKWLTYIALLIAALVVVGDTITFLTYLLRGELTSRFVAKTMVVLLLAGGVFWYYLGSIQTKPSASENAHE